LSVTLYRWQRPTNSFILTFIKIKNTFPQHLARGKHIGWNFRLKRWWSRSDAHCGVVFAGMLAWAIVPCAIFAMFVPCRSRMRFLMCKFGCGCPTLTSCWAGEQALARRSGINSYCILEWDLAKAKAGQKLCTPRQSTRAIYEILFSFFASQCLFRKRSLSAIHSQVLPNFELPAGCQRWFGTRLLQTKHSSCFLIFFPLPMLPLILAYKIQNFIHHFHGYDMTTKRS
jgi:hypothetical protein